MSADSRGNGSVGGGGAGHSGRSMGQTARQVWDALAVPVVAIVLSLVVGAIVILASSLLVTDRPFNPALPAQAYWALFSGSLGSRDGLVETFVQAAPLLLAGLGVGLGFKAGLFNIGAQGQFILGALGAVWIGSMLATSPAIIAIPLALVGGLVAGAIWSGIAGYLKATSGAHEVVTTIMLNYIALSVLSWLASGPLHQPGSPQPVTVAVGNAALPIIVGKDGHLGILVALAAVPLVWFLLYRTTQGFEIRAVGANPDASRYAGVRTRVVIVLTMALAGGLAGLAGAINVLGISHQMPASFSTSVGFDAITVALLGRSNPWGILPAAILLGAMRAGAALMQIQAGVPAELVDVVQAIILLFLVANAVLRRLPGLHGAHGSLGTTETMTGSYGSEAV
ncbi:MAG TPA: ABC transporter permease [Candidatus Saccharimonadales bacterium]|nr:ABC transporter permease [Candidatus Saccharimonadales bacterium]